MARKKRRRFAELASLVNVFDRDDAGPGGAWAREYFGGHRDLILELGCGKGEYTLELARRLRDSAIVGIDRKGDRLWIGARRALAENLTNAGFLRADVEDLALYFDPGQLRALWIPYPDPLPKRRQAKHRLLTPERLYVYRRLLQPGGEIHFKTDDPALFAFVLEAVDEVGGRILDHVEDLYARPRADPLLEVTTTFERRHLARGRKIYYLAFRLDPPKSSTAGE